MVMKKLNDAAIKSRLRRDVKKLIKNVNDQNEYSLECAWTLLELIKEDLEQNRPSSLELTHYFAKCLDSALASRTSLDKAFSVKKKKGKPLAHNSERDFLMALVAKQLSIGCLKIEDLQEIPPHLIDENAAKSLNFSPQPLQDAFAETGKLFRYDAETVKKAYQTVRDFDKRLADAKTEQEIISLLDGTTSLHDALMANTP